jgi:nitrate reductase NapE component
MATRADRPESDRPGARARRPAGRGAETRPSWKTSELLVFLILAIGIFIAAEHVGTSGDNAFTAQRAWLYVTILGAAYIVSRGLAKSGSRATDEDDPRSRL